MERTISTVQIQPHTATVIGSILKAAMLRQLLSASLVSEEEYAVIKETVEQPIDIAPERAYNVGKEADSCENIY